MLIAEAPWLIDDKAIEKCEGKSLKDQFSIKIDSIRKSLDIDKMEDVELLVDTLYNYQSYHEKKVADELKAEEEREAQNEGGAHDDNHIGGLNNDRKAEGNHNNNNGGGVEPDSPKREEEQDPNQLKLDLNLLVDALEKFQVDREAKALKDALDGGAKKKSKESKFTDKTREQSREKKKQKLYWEKMTTILSE